MTAAWLLTTSQTFWEMWEAWIRLHSDKCGVRSSMASPHTQTLSVKFKFEFVVKLWKQVSAKLTELKASDTPGLRARNFLHQKIPLASSKTSATLWKNPCITELVEYLSGHSNQHPPLLQEMTLRSTPKTSQMEIWQFISSFHLWKKKLF